MKLVGLLGVGCLLTVGTFVIAAGCGSESDDVFGSSSTGTAAGGGPAGSGSTTGGGASGASGATSGTGAAGGGAPIGGNGPGGQGGASGGGSNTGGAATCGDFVCEPSECGVCAPDCGPTCLGTCGNGTCDPTESCSTCPADCQTGCGDGCCLLGEDCMNCPADCETVEGCDPGACGNGQCNYGLSETCLNCADCFGLCDCGDGVCALPETAANCPWDC